MRLILKLFTLGRKLTSPVDCSNITMRQTLVLYVLHSDAGHRLPQQTYARGACALSIAPKCAKSREFNIYSVIYTSPKGGFQTVTGNGTSQIARRANVMDDLVPEALAKIYLPWSGDHHMLRIATAVYDPGVQNVVLLIVRTNGRTTKLQNVIF